jgi:hypothetical protein
MTVDANKQLWGAEVIFRYSWDRKHNEDCPAWATPTQQARWIKEGLVIWNHESHQITHLSPDSALWLLNQLRTTDAWQRDGLKVSDIFWPVPRNQDEPPRYDSFNMMVLTADQAAEVLALLVTHEADLRRKADFQEYEIRIAFLNLATYFGDLIRRREVAKIDLTKRPFPWVADTETLTWTCDRPPNRVTVRPASYNRVWEACLERPHRPKHNSPWFATLEETLSWAEHELVAAVAQPPAVPPSPKAWLSLATLTSAHRKRLNRYWIAPSALEPARMTYRIILYVKHVPTERKYLEWSFGERVCYDETYPNPAQVLHRLCLDPFQMDAEAIGSGLFRLTSVATYANATRAYERAYQVGERGALVMAFRTKQLPGAAYGIEEVETKYRSWIGGYGEWPEQQQDRDEWLANSALHLTLIHALDVAGYDALIGGLLTELYPSAEAQLAHLHELRMDSPFIPRTARAESEQWLKEHPSAKATQENDIARPRRQPRKATSRQER